MLPVEHHAIVVYKTPQRDLNAELRVALIIEVRHLNVPILRRPLGSQHGIETSQIAGHANTKITEEYTVVQLRRQEELTSNGPGVTSPGI